MDRVIAHQADIHDCREIENSSKVDHLGQLIALESGYRSERFGEVFVEPLDDILRSFDRFGHGAAWLEFPGRDAVKEKAVRRCDMPSKFESAHRVRMRLKVALVARDRGDHATGCFLFVLYLRKINLIEKEFGLIVCHSRTLSQAGGLREAKAGRQAAEEDQQC